MSHFTEISTEIRDIEVCQKALANMGLKLESNAPCRWYYGTEVMDYVAKLPGPYDMALERNHNGTYRLVADFYDWHVERTIGYRGELVMQNYAIEMIKKVSRQMHMSVSSQSKDTFKVRDPQDPNGGYMVAKIGENGEVTFEPKGIKGKNCTKFLKLEEALGKVVKREFTREYLRESQEDIQCESRQKLKVGY